MGVRRLPDDTFPGTPDPSRICLEHGFDPARLYELVYTAKDPLVLGIGFAATRDIVDFFRHATADAHHRQSRRRPRHASVALGTSQSGNFIKTFVHLGFNEEAAGVRCSKASCLTSRGGSWR